MRLQTRHGLPVFQVQNTTGSATMIRLLYKMLSEDSTCLQPLHLDVSGATAAYTEVLSAQKSANRNLKRAAAGMLCAIPGIGAKMSEGVLDACGGTLEALMGKSQEEIAALKTGKRSVGKVAAEKIWNALHTAT